MTKIKVINVNNNIGEKQFAKSLLVLEVNKQAIFDSVIAENAGKRQGTHSTLTKAEVRGGGIKPRPQKHSGRARQGSIRNPQWVGGGRAFGPKPGRNYKNKVNSKVNTLALKSAFTEKMLANNISYFVTDGALDFKSKNFTKLLESAKLNSTRRILFILDKENASDKAVARSIKNMKNVSVKCINSVSVNDIVLASHVLINENAAEQLGKRGE